MVNHQGGHSNFVGNGHYGGGTGGSYADSRAEKGELVNSWRAWEVFALDSVYTIDVPSTARYTGASPPSPTHC